MKVRITTTIALLAIWGFLNRGIFYTADQVIGQKLAVDTVNGGDAALLAQNAYNASFSGFTLISAAIFLFLLGTIWYEPVKNLFSEDTNKTNN